MNSYVTKSGQSIFDIAMTLHGGIEGVFDLLVSNDNISLDTDIQSSTTIYYHENFVINDKITQWLKDNNIVIRNGNKSSVEHSICGFFMMWLYSYHQEEYDELMNNHTIEEINSYIDGFANPRIMINQNGVECSFSVWVRPNTYLIVDWGDTTTPQIIENTEEELELTHSYKSSCFHSVKLYGNFSLYSLDLTGINGVYYILESVSIDNFTDSLNISELQTLAQ